MDADAVAVAFGGDFDLAVPPAVQMETGAAVLAELLARLGFGVNVIFGRSEVEGGTSSPGMQWSQGVTWRDDLVSLVAARLPETVVE